MTELQAWVYLAWLWDNPHPADELDPDYPWADGSVMAVDVDGVVACGLCDCIANLPDLPTLVRDGMIRKIPKTRLMRRFVWATTRNGAKQRAAFCREQARLLAPKKKRARK